VGQQLARQPRERGPLARAQRRDHALLLGDVLDDGLVGQAAALGGELDVEAAAVLRVRPAPDQAALLEWFRADAVQRSGRVGKNGLPSLPVMAALLTEYDDVFRLAAGGALVRGVLRLIAPLGRRAGAPVASVA
jgi:hypothetical protein